MMIKILTMDGRLVGDDCAVVATVWLKGPRFCDASVFVRRGSSSMMTQVAITSLLIASYCVEFCFVGFCCTDSADVTIDDLNVLLIPNPRLYAVVRGSLQYSNLRHFLTTLRIS